MEQGESARPSDEDLVALCKEQLPYVTGAFEELFKRYHSPVLRTCRRYMGNREEAEEACQDVFLRVFAKISQFEGRSNFRTWLYRVVFNTCVTRRQRLQKDSRLELTTAKEPETTYSVMPEAETGLMEETLAQLSATDREVLLLRFEAELSLEEIAQVVGSKLSATKMRLYRAMDRFRDVYSAIKRLESNEK
jgi:RNA polymerase sigma-70 factor (ECF subfamily)